jgi:hypothetical protein
MRRCVRGGACVVMHANALHSALFFRIRNR